MQTSNQKLADRMIRRQLFAHRFSNKQADEMIKLISKMRPDLLGKLVAALEKSGLKGPSVTDAQVRSALSSADSYIKTYLTDIFKVLKGNLAEFAGVEAEFYADALSGALPDAIRPIVPVATVTGAQVSAAALAMPFQGNTLLKWPESMAQALRNLITNQARNGLLRGASYEDIAREVVNSATGQTMRSVAAVTKSAVNHYAATARDLTAAANADIIDGRQWLSTLDTHTTPMCQLRDRLMYPLEVDASTLGKADGNKVAGSQYGAGPGRLHFCCRSTETWKIKSWRELGIKASEMPEGTRPALDGSVSSGTRYVDWVQRQPRHVLEEIYGIQRADQILKGLKVPQMFNDNGGLFTIEQLRDRVLWRD